MNIEKIDDYKILEELLSLNENLVLYSAENEIDGSEYEILIIKHDKDQYNTIKRIIDGNIKPLIDSKNTGIQKVIECKEYTTKSYFYIVYEIIGGENITQTRDNFEKCIDILDDLKKTNRQGFILKSDTVFLFKNQVKIRFVGLFELFQQFDINFNDEDIVNKRRIKDDIKSLAKLFEGYLYDEESSEKQAIYEKCLKGEYKKYSNIQEDLQNLPYEINDDFSNIGVAADNKKINADDLLIELNKGCYWEIQTKKSAQGEVVILWTTKTCSGKFYVNQEFEENGKKYGYLFAPYGDDYSKDELIKPDNKAFFNFKNNYELSGRCYSIDYFLGQFEEVNELAKLSHTKKAAIEIWKKLPEKEKEYIEEQAFKAKYTKREVDKNNNLNIKFTLTPEFKDWNKIKDKKNDEVMLSIDDSYIGTILDYKPKDRVLIIKDSKLELDEIQNNGQLIEDVQQETSQYKKQVEACEKLEKKDIVNPELAGFIATPEVMPQLPNLDIDYDEWEDKIISDELKTDETQKNAVIGAIHKKPVYLIQGPPGTGKTTVIVELVQQLIQQKPNTKILVASQSNLAVDNVLERLPEAILFMRLASEHAIGKDNILPSMKSHLFDEKLKKWVAETTEKSNDNLTKAYPEVNTMLSHFYTKFNALSKPTITSFQKEYRQGIANSYFGKLFDNCQTIEEVKKVFTKELGDKFIKLQKIQKDWLSFISNATSERSQSVLKNGSKDINLQTAFVKTMNVLGATCIHIASSKYNKISFKFDYMIMDEASKATSAEALVPITMSKNLILIGDHKQLPPVITREDAIKKKVKKELEDEGMDIDKTYGKSLFENLIKEFEISNQLSNYKIMLNIQYRMPRQLGYLISEHIYGGKLKNPDIERLSDYDKNKDHQLKLKNQTVKIEGKEIPNSIIMVSTSKQDNPSDNGNKFKRSNQCNANAIKQIMARLNQEYKDKKDKFSVGIIAGYRGQVELLKNEIKLKDYKPFGTKDINTVDKFQGAERDIIIYDIVRSDAANSMIGFLQDYRRINVAFSRAKKLLIIVGDSEYILKRATYDLKSYEKLAIKEMIKQLEYWDCIYDSLEEALQ